MNEIERFWSGVKKGEENECWNWQRCKGGFYGYFRAYGKQEGVHRFSLQLKLGRRLKKGEWALHHCDNPICVNPNHLFLGNAKMNIQDMLSKGRCKKGDDFGGSKLTEQKVMEIRRRYHLGETRKALGKAFRVTGDNIGRVVKGVSWKQVGGPIQTIDMRSIRSGHGWSKEQRK